MTPETTATQPELVDAEISNDEPTEPELVDGELVDDDQQTPDALTNLYGDDAEIAALAERVILVAPWIHYRIDGKDYQMSKREVSLAIRRCMALGVDPLNQHEIQIWRDKHGLQTQIAYPLLAQWVEQIHGGHTQPQYRELTPEEMELHGLSPNEHAIECSFIMHSDIPHIKSLSDAGFSPQEAARHYTTRGLGTASSDDWSSRYFAPNGRSRRWKLEKRAYTDAIRRRFGSPSRAEIQLLRRLRADVALLPADFDHVATDITPAQQLRCARRSAADRAGLLPDDPRDTALPADYRPRRDQLMLSEDN